MTWEFCDNCGEFIELCNCKEKEVDTITKMHEMIDEAYNKFHESNGELCELCADFNECIIELERIKSSLKTMLNRDQPHSK